MNLQRIEQTSVRGSHHFFEAQVRHSFCVGDKVLSMRTCPSKKRQPSFAAKLLLQMPIGVEWLPGVAASKQSSVESVSDVLL